MKSPKPAPLKKKAPRRGKSPTKWASSSARSRSPSSSPRTATSSASTTPQGLLTAVKEAVDNALDASEEAGHLPEIVVKLEAAGIGDAPVPAVSQATRFKVTVIDHGPGIVRDQIPRVFAKLLYGSKFHRCA